MVVEATVWIVIGVHKSLNFFTCVTRTGYRFYVMRLVRGILESETYTLALGNLKISHFRQHKLPLPPPPAYSRWTFHGELLANIPHTLLHPAWTQYPVPFCLSGPAAGTGRCTCTCSVTSNEK